MIKSSPIRKVNMCQVKTENAKKRPEIFKFLKF